MSKSVQREGWIPYAHRPSVKTTVLIEPYVPDEKWNASEAVLHFSAWLVCNRDALEEGRLSEIALAWCEAEGLIPPRRCEGNPSRRYFPDSKRIEVYDSSTRNDR